SPTSPLLLGSARLTSVSAAARARSRLRAAGVRSWCMRGLAPSKPTLIGLATLWGLLALLVLGDLGEDGRGDSHFLRAIPWDIAVGAILTLVILGVDWLIRTLNTLARPS